MAIVPVRAAPSVAAIEKEKRVTRRALAKAVADRKSLG
jgi:hypothetical protein